MGVWHAQSSHQLETSIRRLSVTSADCSKMMPDGSPEEAARIARLKEDAARVEADLIEAEAQNRLYELLCQRTRHAACSLLLTSPHLHPVQGHHPSELQAST